jgi:hypothetical protein
MTSSVQSWSSHSQRNGTRETKCKRNAERAIRSLDARARCERFAQSVVPGSRLAATWIEIGPHFLPPCPRCPQRCNVGELTADY